MNTNRDLHPATSLLKPSTSLNKHLTSLAAPILILFAFTISLMLPFTIALLLGRLMLAKFGKSAAKSRKRELRVSRRCLSTALCVARRSAVFVRRGGLRLDPEPVLAPVAPAAKLVDNGGNEGDSGELIPAVLGVPIPEPCISPAASRLSRLVLMLVLGFLSIFVFRLVLGELGVNGEERVER